MSSRPDLVDPPERIRAAIRGAVQGVGFRPFVFRLATELGLAGWVNNSAQGVLVEVEGKKSRLETFLRRLQAEKPPRSSIQGLEISWLDVAGYTGFVIRPSDESGPKTSLVMADIATCTDCLKEIFDPGNRRYFYPFTNCTNCGPRFSIIESLPYDRPNTSMKRFTMCPDCKREYDDPADRRFHAQPNACPVCGPQLVLWDERGVNFSQKESSDQHPNSVPVATGGPRGPSQQALNDAVEAIRAGRIVAVKGIGGFHLMARADLSDAVQALRLRKHREEKPFAVMFPSLEAVREACEVSELEERLLLSLEAPIVLLHRRNSKEPGQVCPAVAPGNPNLGVLLPYTPLHHLLLSLLRLPVVATSGNLSDEPICTDEIEAVERLRGIADVFLVHNRQIVRHVDDSIVRVVANREMVLRRARGFAPLPVQVRTKLNRTPGHANGSPKQTDPIRTSPENQAPDSVLAVGAHLKNAVALTMGPQVFISQHIGDLETDSAYAAFRRVIGDLQTLYEVPAPVIAADLHPDYLSTRFAAESQTPHRKIQHHVAHVLSCMAENDLEPPVLGVAWDGTGYGLDGTIWGGEFFLITTEGFERVAHLRPFRLPGGEQSVREPRRSALGLIFEAYGAAAFDPDTSFATIRAFSATETKAIRLMLENWLNSPLTSSVGRLFDAVASVMDLRQRVHFEGQAAMELEFMVEQGREVGAYEFKIVPAKPMVMDWKPCLEGLLADSRKGVAPGVISTRFHNGLVETIVTIAQRTGQQAVVLSGGCFQNRYLVERAVARLHNSGLRPYWHQRVPPNDGGICLGQVVAARSWKV